MKKNWLKMRFWEGCVASVPVIVVMAGSAMATGSLINLSSVDVDTSMVATLGLTVITALAAIWGVRKVVKFINRS